MHDTADKKEHVGPEQNQIKNIELLYDLLAILRKTTYSGIDILLKKKIYEL